MPHEQISLARVRIPVPIRLAVRPKKRRMRIATALAGPHNEATYFWRDI
jgi:hypothetical protein